MRLIPALATALIFSAQVYGQSGSADNTEGPQGQPGSHSPQIFAPGIISGAASDGSPTFTPDGKTLLFTRSGTSWGIILESHLSSAGWSQPTMAPFSGSWSDWSPTFSPDGTYVIYVSIRPVPTHDPKALVANLWRVDRTGDSWSEPSRLADMVNIGDAIWKPSVALDGSVYFVSIDAKGGKRLYCSRCTEGIFEEAQPLPFSDGTKADVDPEIARDGSLLIFCSSGRFTKDGKDHLCFVKREGDGWGPVTPLYFGGEKSFGSNDDQEPRLSPDQRRLFFSSDRSVTTRFPRTAEQAHADLDRLDSWDNSNSNIWSISISDTSLGFKSPR